MSSFGITEANDNIPIPVPPASGGTGTTTVFTQGSSVFAGANGVYSQDNSNYFYDSTATQLRVPSFTHPTANIGTTVNYYVNASTGNNSNSGLSSGSPFLTIQHALDVIAGGLFSGTVTINIAAGTYNENLVVYPMINTQFDSSTGTPNTVVLLGDETTPTNVVISGVSGTVIKAQAGSTAVKLLGLRITSASASATGIVASSCQVYIRNTQIDGCASFVSGSSGAFIERGTSSAGTTWTASNSSGTLISLVNYATFQLDGGTLTLVAGTATATMVAASGFSNVSTVTGCTMVFTGSSGNTQFGIRSLTGSTVSLAGTFTFTNINAAASSNLFSSAACLADGRSAITLFATSSYTFNTVTTAWFLSGASYIEGNGSITPTYTTVTNYIMLDHTCKVDVANLLAIPATGWIWLASRVNQPFVQVTDAFRAGTAVASANNLALSGDGNILHVTGTTQINLISNQNIFYPYYVLIFDGAVTVKDNQGASGNNKPILLNGSADLTTAANTVLTLVYDATNSVWIQVAKSAR